MSLEEIGCATHANLAAVKSRLHRARENLRRMLAPLLETKGMVHGTNPERSSTGVDSCANGKWKTRHRRSIRRC